MNVTNITKNHLLFKIDINLDDEEEVVEFLKKYEPQRGRILARKLGFAGTGSVKSADALMNYAQNKRAAMATRKAGQIGTAVNYESICDRIYAEDIQPHIECW